MSDYRDDRRSSKSSNDSARSGKSSSSSGSRSSQDRTPTRPGARGAGKSYRFVNWAVTCGSTFLTKSHSTLHERNSLGIPYLPKIFGGTYQSKLTIVTLWANLADG